MQAEDVHRLWDDLSDFEVGQSDAAAHRLMTVLAEQTDLVDITWAGAVRLTRGPRSESSDVMRRWRVAAALALHGPILAPHRIWDQPESDPSLDIPLRDLGQFRTYTFRRELAEPWFHSPFYQSHYGARGVEDAAFVAFPINEDCESHFGFWARRPLTDEQVALFTYALRGVKWFHRRLMLSHGLLLASSPLSPTERKVLQLLLTKASEQHIAGEIGLADSTTHQHVVAIYRKFGVRSRAGLMSLWLNRPPKARRHA